MDNILKLKKGLDLPLEGKAADDAPRTVCPAVRVAVTPDDFPGFVPKLMVKEGDSVEKGQPIIRSKEHEGLCLCSPATGTIEAVVRGERRKIIRVVIAVDNANNSAWRIDVNAADAESIKRALMISGLWAAMRQRPYDIVPAPDKTPKNIFVTGFDSAPLAPSLEEAVKGKEREIAAGAEALKKLTDGHIYISTRAGAKIDVPQCATHVIVDGPHPAGNAGIQAANIAPVNKGETIWTLDIVTLTRIGQLMLTGTTDTSTTVAVTGSETVTPMFVATTDGAEIAPLIAGNVKEDGAHHRIISGNVLTGKRVEADGFLRFPYRQITIIPEGDDVGEFMGWASVNPGKMSASRAFPLQIFKKRFAPDARILGGRRAMIMSEQYDKVLPMDILPEYLIKAIISRDIDRMESLGIYEVAPEDFALCEFVDPSKIELQKIVREGLDYLRKELE
ncbi:MAG: Na(+)-translocating NADH-quinone reductase subunit A [Bacteroides sp.]|nr:Na(+)-translocating NADH-quinone reductase subunit A [Bacteroides sp.]